MQENRIYAQGLALNFLESDEFEREIPGDEFENYQIAARNNLRSLMNGWQQNTPINVSFKEFQAIFIKHDYNFTCAMRLAIQQGFDNVFSQLKERQLNEEQLNQALFYISNCLAILPYFDITPHEVIRVPQWINNTWQSVTYHVEPIELTPTYGLKKIFLNNEDRVFAYGLEPLNHREAEPILIFMGTTYPAGQGFLTTIENDIGFFETAGQELYRSGHEAIHKWLTSQPKKTHVCGSSLGGALCLLLARHHGDKLSRVDALNPVGLYESWFKSQFDSWDDITEKPPVYIQKQENDPVSYWGTWKEDWHVLNVTVTNKKGPNPIYDHILNYAGLEGVQFIGVDSKKDNAARYYRNLFIYGLFRGIVSILVIKPYRYLIHPFVHYAITHITQIILILSIAGIFCLSNGLILPVSLTMPWLNIAISSMLLGFFCDKSISWLTSEPTHTKSNELTNLSRSQKLTLVACASLCAIAIIVLTQIINPAWLPVIIYGWFSIPLFITIAQTLSRSIKHIFNLNKSEIVDCHSPFVQRNTNLDPYQHTITAEFTTEELALYHRAQQHDKLSRLSINRHRLFANDSLIRDVDDDLILITADSSKIRHIKQTIQWFREHPLELHDPSDTFISNQMQYCDTSAMLEVQKIV